MQKAHTFCIHVYKKPSLHSVVLYESIKTVFIKNCWFSFFHFQWVPKLLWLPFCPHPFCVFCIHVCVCVCVTVCESVCVCVCVILCVCVCNSLCVCGCVCARAPCECVFGHVRTCTFWCVCVCVCNVSSAWRDQMSSSDSVATITENASRLGYKHVCVNYLHVASHVYQYQEVIQHTHTHTSTHTHTHTHIHTLALTEI